MYRADTHVHSTFSFDGKVKAEDLVLLALQKGLTFLSFTEHLDLCTQSFDDFLTMERAFSEEVSRLNLRYGDRIQIVKGLEFAEPHRYQKELLAVEKMNFGYLLGAVHFIDGRSVARKELPPKENEEHAKRYYEELFSLVTFGRVDAVAHFDHIRRGIGEDRYQLSTLRDIFKEMIRKDIVLEVNTSGIRRTNGEPFPSREKVLLYRSLGGNKVTIGSDTHIESNLYQFVEETYGELTFGGMTPGVFSRRTFVTR